jgi:soluble lytic murein transglycosylase-like protein
VSAAPVDLPEWLRRGVARVEDFVSPDERPPELWSGDLAEWRAVRGWRRWQDAVEQWGQERGLDRAGLMDVGAWPSSPLPFLRCLPYP